MDKDYINYNFIKKDKTIDKKCGYCGDTYGHVEGNIEYKYDKLTFCCFDHYRKYLKSKEVKDE